MLALLDWEMAGVSDPMLDLGYVMQFYDQGENKLGSAGYEHPGWWPRERTIAEWEQATGREAVDLNRYEALEVSKVGAIIALGYHLYTSGRANDPRFEGWQAVIPGYVEMAVRCAQG